MKDLPPSLLLETQPLARPPISPSVPRQPPEKIHVKSAIQIALGHQAQGQSVGLMKWFTRSSPEDYRAHAKKVDAMIDEGIEEYESIQKIGAERCKREQREQGKMRQQKHRQKVYAAEITRGIRSPGGTKRRQQSCFNTSLEDINRKSGLSVAELTRPYRTFKEKQRRMKKHPQGRKQIHGPRPTTYHNWHTPFLWNQIVRAASHPSVGWKMSSSQIVSLLKQRDPTSFARLSRTTVEGWIDRSGGRPTWSARALQKANDGNDPGLGNKGGRQGIFVRLISLSIPKPDHLPLLQANFPTVEKAIIDRLNTLRDGSVPLTLVTIRGVVVAILMDMAPEIFDIKASDGSSFRCSDSFLRAWLRNTMGW